jgi:hypothetical protein
VLVTTFTVSILNTVKAVQIELTLKLFTKNKDEREEKNEVMSKLSVFPR